MQETVTVTIRYFAEYVKKTQKKQETFTSEGPVNKVFEDIVKYLDSEYGIKPPFNALLDGRHITGVIKEQRILKGGEVIDIIPFISGG